MMMIMPVNSTLVSLANIHVIRKHVLKHLAVTGKVEGR